MELPTLTGLVTHQECARSPGAQRPESSRSVGYRYQQRLEEGNRGNRGCSNSRVCWNFRRNPARMNRLLLSTTLFLYNICRLLTGFSNYDGTTTTLLNNIAIAICFMIWDFWESMSPNSNHVSGTMAASLVIIEVLILLGLLALITTGLIRSAFIVYRAIANYLRKRRQQRQQYVIVFTRTGDPVVVISEPRHPDIPASRLSADSLIQAPGQSDV
ncbi:hypothetical protein K449DRAFT_428746 [Hypoxylon sp. EC38]|nr:hypothetical protein K449DRAFT_428746 [Hypoxylon sp. EC38]